MPNLYTLKTASEDTGKKLSSEEVLAIYYHNIFDFPLNFRDLIRWTPAIGFTGVGTLSIRSLNGYFFLDGREGNVYKRLLRKRISSKKIEIAKKAAKLISFIPFVKLVAVTGSLAMENATDESDIDLIIVTKHKTLWTTRLLTYFLLSLFQISFRRSGDKKQKDKLCLNMWLDERDLYWNKNDRNLYTAHEIAQIMPLINKNSTYEKFMNDNKWLLKYWPNSVKISERKEAKRYSSALLFSLLAFLEKLAFWLQYRHMRSKITRETVTATRAFFHPQDWGKAVLDRLNLDSLE